MKRTGVLFVLIMLGTALAACRSAENSQEKIAVVERYIMATNEKDRDQAASYLADDVVFDTPTGRCEGVESCLAMGGGPIREDPSNFSVEGNTVRWEMIVTFPTFTVPALGEAIVENGKIRSYTVLEP